MEQIYIDTLKAVMVYKYELDAAVLELERVSHNNTPDSFMLFPDILFTSFANFGRFSA